MKKRNELDTNYTWDLTALYKTKEEWEIDLQEIEKLANSITQNKGRIISSAQDLYENLTNMDTLGIKLERAASYARMAFDVNMGDSINKHNYEKIDNVITKISDKLAFFEPELLLLDPSVLKEYIDEIPDLSVYSFMFEKLFAQKDHILSTTEEEILTRLDSLGSSFNKIYDDITVNDLIFPEIENEKREKIIANEVNYRKMLTSYDRSLRESFFKGLLATYGSHINSLTSATYGNLKYRLFVAKTRNYRSSREMSLKNNHIPIEVYDTLIKTVRSNVHQLQRYFALRQKTLGYSDLHFYDLFVPLMKDINYNYTFEEAQDIVLKALNILGDDYQLVLKEAFSKRWIDVYPNKGKVPGAYANGIYNLHPYSLLNFTGTLEDLFTMAHELGHVMHSYYSNKNQPYVDSNYVIFTAEVASTVNEYLLYRYLLNKAATKEETAYLLSMHLDSIRSTLFRQTFFADFEAQMHQLLEEEKPVTPDTLCTTYKKLYELYHGPQFVIDEELTYEWARIPHFYNSFYVYQYATGISAAIALAKKITTGEPDALANYLNFLLQGGSDYPINLLQQAGVDMSTSEPIIAALQDFSETLDQLETAL
ncbi:MAG: oligoendopeptidase F [Firmicutes bacterium HGW-Firmicutes-12]|nr:MAG: oligoendopeptidase F [Firmicutes bacterium HGW-Firmicutes-12]